MKSFKKALAVMLSVLMVVFSFPFSAMALENPNMGDGNNYSTDTDVVMHCYAMPYVAKDCFGPEAYVTDAEGNYDPLRTHDLTKMNFADLLQDQEDADTQSALDHPTFCLVFTVENLDPGYYAGEMYVMYDATVIQPAYYNSNKTAASAYKTGSNAEAPLRDCTYWEATSGIDTTGTSAQDNGKDQIYFNWIFNDCDFANETVWEDDDATTMPGQVVGVFGFELLQDNVDLTQYMTVDIRNQSSYFATEAGKNDVLSYLCCYGVKDVNGDAQNNTVFTIPELGLAPAETSKDVTYTYTFANDGGSTTVTAPEGTEPTAPDNTATTTVSNENGTHTTTSYSWPAFEQGTTAYTEVASTSTVPCTKVVDAEAVAPGHETPGSTEAWHCSVCNYTVASTTVGATGHTWDAGVVTPATCTDRGYTTYTCTAGDGGTMVSNYTDPDPNNHTGLVTDNAVPATCTATGLTEGSHCTACGKTVVAQQTVPVDSSNHTKVVTDKAVDPTCTDPGRTAGSHCQACGTVITAQQEVPALDHDWQVKSSTDATCKTAGTVTSECSRCHETKTESGVLDPNNHEGNIVTDAAVPATCTSTGLTEGSHCDACGKAVVAQTETPINPSNHAWDAGVITKKATRAEDGVKTYTCTRDASHTKTEAIPALGVQITVTANELGTTTLNGTPTTGAAQKVAYESTYTLKATANEGAEFIGWMVNGKMVSTNAVYTTGAYADLTYVPVFAPKATVDFVVTFIDQFNKVIATIASSELADLIELPSAPDYPHYTFEGYDLTLDEVKALKDSTVVTASYAKDETTYTVTAYGCTITVDGVDYQETATVAHDARVTVKPNSADVAKSWTVNSSQAAFGAEYTFYVTADVEVAYSTLDVTAAPTVANVSMDQIDDVKVRFLATRSVTDGYTLLESGFVYGKDMDSADLVLDNVNGTTCRVIKNSNMAADGQFALTVGIASKTGKIGVAAYIIVKDSAGTVSAIYAPVQEWTY